uniref:Uncharacterized protein n=1 Tax=Plectus sambesii TaxID=2011161 RepID=A0A914X3V1_9BILA
MALKYRVLVDMDSRLPTVKDPHLRLLLVYKMGYNIGYYSLSWQDGRGRDRFSWDVTSYLAIALEQRIDGFWRISSCFPYHPVFEDRQK